jgi:hypothetical protein
VPSLWLWLTRYSRINTDPATRPAAAEAWLCMSVYNADSLTLTSCGVSSLPVC